MKKTSRLLVALISTLVATSALADSACSGLPSQSQLKAALDSAVTTDGSGFNLNMWATVVNRDGVVCAVA